MQVVILEDNEYTLDKREYILMRYKYCRYCNHIIPYIDTVCPYCHYTQSTCTTEQFFIDLHNNVDYITTWKEFRHRCFIAYMIPVIIWIVSCYYFGIKNAISYRALVIIGILCFVMFLFTPLCCYPIVHTKEKRLKSVIRHQKTISNYQPPIPKLLALEYVKWHIHIPQHKLAKINNFNAIFTCIIGMAILIMFGKYLLGIIISIIAINLSYRMYESNIH